MRRQSMFTYASILTKSLLILVKKIFLINYLFIFRERGREGDGDREKHRWERKILVASYMCHNWEPNLRPGICPGQELNWQHFALWDNAQPTGAQQDTRQGSCQMFYETSNLTGSQIPSKHILIQSTGFYLYEYSNSCDTHLLLVIYNNNNNEQIWASTMYETCYKT